MRADDVPNETVLGDLGEHAIIERLLRPRYEATGDFGGDSAILMSAGQGFVVGSVDPAPTPLCYAFGFDDPYYLGWLATTINVSDVTVAGGTGVRLLSSITVPAAWKVGEFRRLLDGMDDSAEAHGARYVGGNLRDGRTVDVCVTAVATAAVQPVGRHRAAVGDSVVLIGRAGNFWAGVLAAGRRPDLISAPDGADFRRALLLPRAQVEAAPVLRADLGITAAIDNSDGLLGCLRSLARASRVAIEIDVAELPVGEPAAVLARSQGIDPAALALGFGDWNIVATVGPGALDDIIGRLTQAGVPAVRIGEAVEGRPGTVLGRVCDRRGPLGGLDMERFSATSWHLEAAAGFVDEILSQPVVRDAVEAG